MGPNGHNIASQAYDGSLNSQSSPPPLMTLSRNFIYGLIFGFAASLVLAVIFGMAFFNDMQFRDRAEQALQLCAERAEAAENVAYTEASDLRGKAYILEEAKEDCHQELDNCYASQARFLDALVSEPGGSSLLGQYRFQVEGDLQECQRMLSRYQDENDHEDPCQSELNECQWYLQDSVPIKMCLDTVDSMSKALDECLAGQTPGVP